ncbi:esterase E4 [Drosophila innubila]|uniref:esterase E4 n=1 Tax=Drosophila innubila TaxID=198719 RepID=UPI00148B9275|nr:esterase E4 [Drosophila innubila]
MWTVLCGILYSTLVVRADLDVCLKDQGCLRGTMMPGYRGDAFEAFMGIPFAQPPIKDLRFQNPVAANGWEGILNASVPHTSCLQKCYFLRTWPVFGDEDCLYLNVYRPVVSQEDQSAHSLPVMVYFHSGGFACGSSDPHSVGPEYLMDTQQVILVTTNNRLGPFGFLSTGDRHMSGNFGFKDQRLALQWVQQHIASFGGDPDLVTIFGHSAGGMSSHLHMLSPNSKGLFHRTISLSGTALSAMVRVRDPLAQARQLAEQVGVPQWSSLDTQQLAESLREVDALKILEGGDIFKVWNNGPLVNYAAVVEQDATSESFFNEDFVESHMAGRIHQVPWLLGISSRAGEGALFLLHIYTNPQFLKEFNENFLEFFPLTLYLPEGTSTDTVKDLLALYDVQEMELNERTIVPLSNIVGDFDFLYPLYASAEKYAGYTQEPLSIYSFEYRSQSNISFSRAYSEGIVQPELLPAHMDDGLHTIRMPILLPDFPKDSEDNLVTKRLTSLLVEFAKTGVFYNETKLPACKAVDFTTEEMCKYLRFGQQNGVYQETIERSMDLRGLPLWKKLYL